MTAVQSPLGAGAADAHHAQTHSRLMVLLFTDVVGSTELKNRLGTVEYAELLGRHDRIFRQIIAAMDGSRILKDTGDGFFVSFATAGSDTLEATCLYIRSHVAPRGAFRRTLRRTMAVRDLDGHRVLQGPIHANGVVARPSTFSSTSTGAVNPSPRSVSELT